jgi:hypothetical protein
MVCPCSLLFTPEGRSDPAFTSCIMDLRLIFQGGEVSSAITGRYSRQLGYGRAVKGDRGGWQHASYHHFGTSSSAARSAAHKRG